MDIHINREFLKQLRLQRALSQDALAAASGLHVRTVQRIESSGTASIQSLRSIARALEVDSTRLERSKDSIESDARTFLIPPKLLLGVGAALLWFALSALVWVAGSNGHGFATPISLLGFASLCLAFFFVAEGHRRF